MFIFYVRMFAQLMFCEISVQLNRFTAFNA